MADYKKMYLRLFNEVTDALEKLDGISENLKRAQQDCEDIFIETSPYFGESEGKLVVLKTDNPDIDGQD